MYDEKVQQRFWSKVAITDDDSCWLWRANQSRDGYGRVTIQGKTLGTHRVAWEMIYGPIPDGMLIAHRCDVRLCVRPDHLFLADTRENSRDRINKGHYGTEYEYVGPIIERWKRPNLQERFGEKLRRLDNGCQEWTGYKGGGGYGYIQINGRARLAHRVAWEWANGDIPDDLVICHRCDNPACCNVEHLFLGTHRDNVQDMIRKGRAPKHHVHNHKLTQEQAEEIRRLYQSGKHNQQELADQFGVSRGSVQNLITNKTWRTRDLSRKRLTPARGERHYRSHLTEEIVSAIREAHKMGVPQTELGRRYGISNKAIHSIVHRKTWKHVP